MKNKFFTLLSLSVFTLLMLVSFASASLTLEENSWSSTTVDHNSEATISFNLTATDDYDSLDWSESDAGSKATWKTLPTITSINNGDEITLTAVLKVNQYASGTISDAKLKVKDNLVLSNELTLSAITINQDKSLSLTSETISYSENTTTLTLTNDGNTLLENIQITASGDFDVNISGDVDSSDKIASISEGTTKLITITRTSSLSGVGPQSVTVTATADDETTTTGKVSTNLPFYTGENQGNLKVSDIDFNTESGFGDDEDYWYPFDEVKIDFNVDNKGEWDIEDIEIEACIWDEEDEKCIFDEDDMDISDDKFDLDEGDDLDVTMIFEVDADELEEGNTEYTVYIKAVGIIDDNSAPDDVDGDKTGDSDSQEIEIVTDDEFVIINDIHFEPASPVTCGSEVQITADVWNVGDDDLDDDEVYVLVYNKALGINEEFEFSSGIDAMDSEKISFYIQIPEDFEEGTYKIEFIAYDDEDMSDGDVFETSKEDEEAIYSDYLTIEGNCIFKPEATISTSLQSGGIAGEELVVKATVTNTASETRTFTTSADGYSSWSELVDVAPEVLVLDSEESEDILITLNVNKDVSGEKAFSVILTEDENVISQPVTVTIEKAGFNFNSITGGIISEENWYLWGIGALNIILVLIIIFVAVRLVRKKE